MNILITSGGTSIPIDNVRSIKNFSTGSFGCKIAKHFLLAGDKVTHLHAVDAPTPFEFKVNMLSGNQTEDYASKLDAMYEFSKNYMKNYRHHYFSDFNSYRNILKHLIINFQFDCVILCAAVSDYGTPFHDGKISSSVIEPLQLYPLPKVIKEVRKIFDGKLVGFKLLSNVTDYELNVAAQKQINESGSDFVVANKLEDIQFSDNKRMFLVTKTGTLPIKGSSNSCAKSIVELIRL